VQAAFKADVPVMRMDVPRIYGKLLTEAYAAWQAAGGNGEALGKLPDDMRQLAEVLLGPGAPPVRVAIAREWIQPRWRLELTSEDGAVRVDFDEVGRALLAIEQATTK